MSDNEQQSEQVEFTTKFNPKNVSRVTVVEDVYYHKPNIEPTVQISTKASRVLTSEDEEVWSYAFKVKEEWIPIQTGYIEKPALFILQNETGKFLGRNPNDSEKTALEEAVIEVRIVGDAGSWEIRPQESLRGLPSNPLEVRCRSGLAKVRVTIIPE